MAEFRNCDCAFDCYECTDCGAEPRTYNPDCTACKECRVSKGKKEED